MDPGTGDPVWRSNSPASRIAIIAALELEASIPRKHLGEKCPPVLVSGPGGERAYSTAKRAIDNGALALVSWGLAGGLIPAAATGTVVLPSVLISGVRQWSADSDWRARIVEALSGSFSVHDGPLVSADRVVTTPEEKTRLATSSGAAAVDMESAAVADACAEHGLPFVALRVIADGPNDALPDNVEALVTANGRTRLRGLLGVIGSFKRLRLLFRLAANSRQARGQLERVMSHLREGAE